MPTERTLTVDGVRVSEVSFYYDDGFPRPLGYMVGPDDGKSTLWQTPEMAVEKYRARQPAAPTGAEP